LLEEHGTSALILGVLTDIATAPAPDDEQVGSQPVLVQEVPSIPDRYKNQLITDEALLLRLGSSG
jgi:hypothetical protein